MAAPGRGQKTAIRMTAAQTAAQPAITAVRTAAGDADLSHAGQRVWDSRRVNIMWVTRSIIQFMLFSSWVRLFRPKVKNSGPAEPALCGEKTSGLRIRRGICA